MLRWIVVVGCLWFAVCAGLASAQTVTLRARVEANSTALLLGDVFDGAGEAAGRAIAPAPPPGQVSTLSIPFLAAVVSAEGLTWTPPQGLMEVRVVRPGGLRATLPRSDGGANEVRDIAVRRGEMVALVYIAPGLQVQTRARAMENGGVGDTVRLQNTSSNLTVDAIVTGPNMARAVTQ